MTQKILGGHAREGSSGAELTRIKVDQVVLAREPNRILSQAIEAGLRKAAVEVAVAYPRHCIGWNASTGGETNDESYVPISALEVGVQVARPGIGFAPIVHLERFGSPARLVLTDEPRLAAVGGAAALPMPASTAQLVEALQTGFA